MTPQFHRLILFVVLVFFSCINPSQADFVHNSEASREAIIGSSRSKKFHQAQKTTSRVALGGNYDNDQNSKQYQINSRYFYYSYRFINEINFLQESEYNDIGSGRNKQTKVKTSELYDISFSSKVRIADSKNYGVVYHRTVYDEFSPYYYDLHSAIGFGRMFFDDNFEFDLSIGYQDTKNFGNQTDIIPSIRLNFKLTNRLTFNQRGYWFIGDNSTDNDLRTSIIYRLNPTTSFEVRHSFEQRKYNSSSAGRPIEINQVRNLVTFGFVFDL